LSSSTTAPAEENCEMTAFAPRFMITNAITAELTAIERVF
jgi:hypothetical protein